MQLRYIIKPSRIAAILGIISLYLAAQSLFNEYLIEKVLSSGTNDTAIVLLDLFSVNSESTIPTWYSVLLLFTAALLLWIITLAKWRRADRFKYYWAGLASIFVYLSIDEGAAIHEILSDPLESMFHSTGYLAFGWEIVAIPLVILLGLAFVPFLLHLTWRWRTLFAASGAVYVTGALAFEAISANRWYTEGGITLPYLAIGTIEELFEMLGAVLFIYTLLAYMAETRQPRVLTFATSPDTQAADAEILPGVVSPKAGSKVRVWLVLTLFGFLLIANIAIYLGARASQRAQDSTSLESVPFYRTVLDQYGGEGMVVLQIKGAFRPDNPLTQQVASSLLVLFNDVMVVSLPQENYSLAFASSTSLPFTRDDLRAILLSDQDGDFAIFDTQEIQKLALKAPP